MKKILLFSLLMVVTICATAQNAAQARKVLDKTAAIVGRKGGASANFSITSSKLGKTNGSISIKGNKFYARTPQAIVWFDGKTQWSWMKQTNEVNITTPTEAKQAQMNPYKFINIYRSGYNLDMKTEGNNYIVHMVAQNKQRTLQEMYITVSKKSYTPSQVKYRQDKNWTTIAISNFQAKNVSNSTFVFQTKDFPKAEVIDLR